MKITSKTKVLLVIIAVFVVMGIFLSWKSERGKHTDPEKPLLLTQKTVNAISTVNEVKFGIELKQKPSTNKEKSSQIYSSAEQTTPSTTREKVPYNDLPLPVPWADYGLFPTDLTSDETKIAETIFLQQTQIYENLKRITANITIRVVPDVNDPNNVEDLAGILDLRITRNPWRYVLEIRDPCNLWTFTASDFMDTKLSCADSTKREALERMLDYNIAFMACLPHLVLVPVISRHGPNDVFRALQPWRSREAEDVPQSYTFKDFRGNCSFTEPSSLAAFRNGHLSAWEKTFGRGSGTFGQGRRKVVFSGYRDSDAFPFPTKIDMRYPTTTERQLLLDNIEVTLD